MKDLEEWHNQRLKPSLFLLSLVSQSSLSQINLNNRQYIHNPFIQNVSRMRRALSKRKTYTDRSAYFLPDNVYANKQKIPSSTSQWARLYTSNSEVIIDTIDCSLSQTTFTQQSVHELAWILSSIDPNDSNVLHCHGINTVFDAFVPRKITNFELIFDIPPQLSAPISLRSMLLNGMLSVCDLDSKFYLAQYLARGISSIHSARFVHKNLRPESVILFEREKVLQYTPYLVGFEEFRLDNSETMMKGTSEWYKNLYRHPDRQGVFVKERFIMQHDIYSLGVMLLEIGMGISFIIPKSQGSFTPHEKLDIAQIISSREERKRRLSIKRQLVKIAKEALPTTMGRKYTEIVYTCLTCLDKPKHIFDRPKMVTEDDSSDNQDAEGDDISEDEYEINIGVQFIQQVSA